MNRSKREIVAAITELLGELIEQGEQTDRERENKQNDKPMEMLTIKECSETIKGLSEHTIRQLIRQGKLAYLRTGRGERGKILVNKAALVDYISNNMA